MIGNSEQRKMINDPIKYKALRQTLSEKQCSQSITTDSLTDRQILLPFKANWS